MKISIIGGGNMGGSIACGLASGSIFKTSDITVIDISQQTLSSLAQKVPGIHTASNYDTLPQADIIILAVKP